MSINVAIDGPAGAGKSTLARSAAAALGYIYVDTGALYRTVGLYSIRKGYDTKDAEKVISTLPEIDIKLGFVGTEQRVFLNGEDVSEAIRTPEASMGASNVSAIPKVREFLFDLQKDIAKNNDCLMDGRDIGTVVLPDAQVKIFLTASPEIRATRRYNELKEKGMDVNFDDVLDDIIKRDYQDSHREIAPLKAADDAVLLDTSDRDFDGNLNALLDIVKSKINND
ncbi:MAG: (d)CMP kinase [Clostridia bacterium]|nr:(d)CMP kinase [Clostridia bacterium]